MSTEADDREYRAWQEAVARDQQSLFSHFGYREFDAIPKERMDLIRTKISWYAFCKDFMHLTEDEEKKEMTSVNRVIDRLKDFSGDREYLLLGCVYIHIRLKEDKSVFSIPVFKIKRCKEDEFTIFYEMYSDRFYKKGWKEYEEDTRLPACWMAYPKQGTYKARTDDVRRVHLEFRKSPSWDAILPIVDIVSMFTGGIASGVCAVSLLFPPLLPLGIATGAVMATSAIYGSVRSICELVDRDDHEQNCRPTNPVALFHWLNIGLSAGSAFATGASMAFRVAAENGLNITATCMKVIQVLSVSVNCTGVLVTVVQLIMKFFSEDGLDWSDLKTFVSLIFFLTNIVVTESQSRKILEIFITQPHRIDGMFNMMMTEGIIYSLIRKVEENLPCTKILNTYHWEKIDHGRFEG